MLTNIVIIYQRANEDEDNLCQSADEDKDYTCLSGDGIDNNI